MGLRLNLQAILENTLGSRNVYFQPPATMVLKYPCIVYTLNNIDTRSANDKSYLISKQYRVTIIDPNPDSDIPNRVIQLPTCSFIRHFTADNLNHDVYNIYY